MFSKHRVLLWIKKGALAISTLSFLLLPACAEKKETSAATVQDTPSAAQYFKQFEASRPTSAIPKAPTIFDGYLQSRRLQSDQNKDVYYKTNLFLLPTNEYVFEYFQVDANEPEKGEDSKGEVQFAVRTGKWFVKDKALALEGLGTLDPYTTDEGKAAVKLQVTEAIRAADGPKVVEPKPQTILVYKRSARILPSDLVHELQKDDATKKEDGELVKFLD